MDQRRHVAVRDPYDLRAFPVGQRRPRGQPPLAIPADDPGGVPLPYGHGS